MWKTDVKDFELGLSNSADHVASITLNTWLGKFLVSKAFKIGVRLPYSIIKKENTDQITFFVCFMHCRIEEP